MSEQIEMPEETLAPRGVGPQLRLAREKMGLTTEQVAAKTRISQRYIEAIEDGDFGALPGSTYAMGFARSVAKVVGLDQKDVAAMVRAELDQMMPDGDPRRQTYEPGDPARAPTRGLVWFSLVAVVLLIAGLFFAARLLFAPAAELPSLVEQQEQAEAEDAAAAAADAETVAPDAAGEVVFTAEGPAWVRFYDAQDRVLMERELAAGESYTVPAEAEGVQLITGRPDLLAITIGGTPVPKLSEELETVQDVPVDAASLLARPAPAPSASAAATPGPAQGE